MVIQKKIILVFGIFAFIIVLLMAINVFFGDRGTQPPTLGPTPTKFIVAPSPTPPLNPPIPAQEKEYENASGKIEAQEKEIRKEQQSIVRFKENLPYVGKYITITYDISVNEYDVVVDRSFPKEGEQELQALLDSYGIERSSLDINIK